MIKKTLFFLVSITGGLLLSLTACKDKNNDDAADFDKAPIMVNLADNYIIPGYADLQNNMNTLQTAWNNFLADQSAANLETTKTAWIAANHAFQRVKIFDLGPANTNGLAGALGTFPADTAQIQTNISAGTYNLLTAENVDAIGFDALDYLFYRPGALTSITASTTTQQYITDLISKMKSEVDTVVTAWNSGYRATFVAGVGTSSTSPFALLVNSFCKDFELAKTTKLGIPIGMQSLGILQPHYLEARRSGIGQALMLSNFQAIHKVFQGTGLTSGSNGKGFDDYLNAIEKGTLSSTIDTRFDYLETQPNTWTGGIEGMMNSNNQTLIDYYNYLQGTVVYMKTDMSSAFGVLITYQDNDGD